MALAYAYAADAERHANANRAAAAEPPQGMAQAFAATGLPLAGGADAGGGAPGGPVRTEYLWPCNVKHWALWCELSTQWRFGPSGPTGIDYAGVRAHLEVAHQLRGRSMRCAWEAVRACEIGALRAWRDASERQRARDESMAKSRQL